MAEETEKRDNKTNTSSNEVNYRAIMEDLYKKFIARDGEGVLDFFSEDVKMIIPGPKEILPFAGEFNGKEEARIALTYFFSKIRITKFIVLYMLVDGNRVDAHCFEDGKASPFGKKFIGDMVQSWELNKNGKVTLFKSFYNTYDMAQVFLEVQMKEKRNSIK